MCDALAYHNTLASASNQRLSEWTTSGDGYFIKPFEINSIYFSGTNDKAAGQVNLTIKSYGYDMVRDYRHHAIIAKPNARLRCWT
jgi:hypothetical protein